MFDTVQFKKLFAYHFEPIGFNPDFYSEHSPIDYGSVLTFANNLNYFATEIFRKLLNSTSKSFDGEIFDKFSTILKIKELGSSDLYSTFVVIEKSLELRVDLYEIGLDDVGTYLRLVFDQYPNRISSFCLDKMGAEERSKLHKTVQSLSNDRILQATYVIKVCKFKFVDAFLKPTTDLLKNKPFKDTEPYFSHSDKSQVPKEFNRSILDELLISADVSI